MTKIAKMIEEAFSKIQKETKLAVRTDTRPDGSTFLGWIIEGKPSSKGGLTEQDLFKKHLDDINKADQILLDIAQYCDKNKIVYNFKICKYRKLCTDAIVPVLLNSDLVVNFPETEYYRNNVNDSIPDAVEEFKQRNNLISK